MYHLVLAILPNHYTHSHRCMISLVTKGKFVRGLICAENR